MIDMLSDSLWQVWGHHQLQTIWNVMPWMVGIEFVLHYHCLSYEPVFRKKINFPSATKLEVQKYTDSLHNLMVCWFEAASTHNLMQMVVTAWHTIYGQNISWSPSNANGRNGNSDDISRITCFASMGNFDHRIKLGQCSEGLLLPDYHPEQLELERIPNTTLWICDCDYDYVILWILYDSECWSSCVFFSHALLIVITGIAQSSLICSVVVVGFIVESPCSTQKIYKTWLPLVLQLYDFKLFYLCNCSLDVVDNS